MWNEPRPADPEPAKDLHDARARTVIELANRRGFEIVERRIMPEEMAEFDECFICGTGAEVTPVSEIGPYKFTPGPISRALIEDYDKEVNAASR